MQSKFPATYDTVGLTPVHNMYMHIYDVNSWEQVEAGKNTYIAFILDHQRDQVGTHHAYSLYCTHTPDTDICSIVVLCINRTMQLTAKIKRPQKHFYKLYK